MFGNSRSNYNKKTSNIDLQYNYGLLPLPAGLPAVGKACRFPLSIISFPFKNRFPPARERQPLLIIFFLTSTFLIAFPAQAGIHLVSLLFSFERNDKE